MDLQIINFYLNQSPDHKGRFLKDILNFSYEEMEREHDYIQWLFPLPEPSFINEEAPLLDENTLNILKDDEELREIIKRMFNSIIMFFLCTKWIDKPHNYLRISRILRFLSLCNFHEDMQRLLGVALKVSVQNPGKVSNLTLKYWLNASLSGL